MVRGIVKILHDDVFPAHCETVAITRARALLIVVGDPDILCLDGVWQGFLAYVKKNGGWRGKGVDCAIELDGDGNAAQAGAHEDYTELIQRLQSLSVKGTHGWPVPNLEDEGSDMDEEAYDDKPAVVDD